MKQSYVKNAAILTGSSFVLRLAGMGFRIWLARVLGGEGVGVYELILAFYSVFITLSTSGVSVAATRLFTEEFSHSAAAAKGMARLLSGVAVLLGGGAAVVQWMLADAAAQYWLGDIRAASAIRAAAPSLPFMALAAVLRGFFLARRRVEPNVCSQLIEQAVRILLVFALLKQTAGAGVGMQCAAVLLGTTISEAVSTAMMLLFYAGARGKAYGTEKGKTAPQAGQRLWAILWPVEGSRCLSSGLHTAENMLVPACLAVYLAGAGGRSAAVTQYGVLKGMAMPLMFFPFGILGALATLLMPEITEAHVRGQRAQLEHLLDRMLALTMYAALLAGAFFVVFGKGLAQLLYQSEEAGFYLSVLVPVMPMMYLESMVDGALKGLGEQKAGFWYTATDSALRIAGVILLLPRFGMAGFLFVMIVSNTYTCLLNVNRLLRVTKIRLRPWRWLVAPLCAAVVSAAAGQWVYSRFAPGWLALICGGAAMAVCWLLAGWALGLRALLRSEGKAAETRNGKNAEFEKTS